MILSNSSMSISRALYDTENVEIDPFSMHTTQFGFSAAALFVNSMNFLVFPHPLGPTIRLTIFIRTSFVKIFNEKRSRFPLYLYYSIFQVVLSSLLQKEIRKTVRNSSCKNRTIAQHPRNLVYRQYNAFNLRKYTRSIDANALSVKRNVQFRSAIPG